MNIKKIASGVLAASAVTMACVAPAKALPVTFAQFQLGTGAAANPFTFTNSGSGSTFTVTGSVPVNFSYNVPNGYGVTHQNIAATLTLTSVVDGQAATNNSGTNKKPIISYAQDLKSFNLTITANTKVRDAHGVLSNVLLSLTDSTSTISGGKGANSVGLLGDTTQGDVVTFGSSFLDFSNTINRDFSLSFSSVTPSYQIDQNGYLANFVAAGTGTFASDPAPRNPVPEPAPVAGFLIGGAGLAVLAFRGRKTSRLTA